MNPWLDELARLRARVEALEAELAEREGRFNRAVDALIRHFRITVYQARLLAALASGRVMSRAELERLCKRSEFGDDRNIDSLVKRLRRRNLPGIEVNSVYGAGYVMEGETLRLVRAVIAAGGSSPMPGEAGHETQGAFA